LQILFFTFDGIDGAGKSTQMTLFVQWLRERGLTVSTCRDPGTTPLGEAVREILLGAEYRIDNRAEMLLYMACRAQLVQEVIRPTLERGETIVSDRFILANVAYQGSAGAMEPDVIWQVGEIATGQLLPDLTFVLDLDPESAAMRLGDNHDRMEARGLAYFANVRNGFLQQAACFPDSHCIVDASRTVEEIQTQIRAAAEKHIQGN
jgi:dTMP kinase